MKRGECTNTFQDGMVLDINPLVAPNTGVSNCLNGTLITFDGNEHVLQNDMGNGRVETAYLPEGYIPLGTCSFGGIIYIVSYNPDNNLCQIGSFPSPERNITSDEISEDVQSIKNSDFVSEVNGLKQIKSALKKLDLAPNIIFSPGDKFKIYFGNRNPDTENLTDYGSTTHIYGADPKYLRIHVVSIDEDNNLTFLDEGLKWFKTGWTGSGNDVATPSTDPNKKESKAYIIGQYADTTTETGGQKVNLDSYRDLVSTPYNIFKSKTNGRLALFFELETVDTFSYTWEALEAKDGKYKIRFNFYTTAENQLPPKYIFFTNSNLDLSSVGGITKVEKGNSDNPDSYYIEWPKVDKAYEHSYSVDLNFTLSDPLPVWNFTLTPSMDFGLIPYLAVDGQIDFSKIGRGIYNITQWRYYNNTSTENSDGSLLLTFESEAYPSPNERINSIDLIFVPYTISESDLKAINSMTLSRENLLKIADVAIYTIRDKISYSGIFTQSIPYERSQSNLQGIIHENYFYQVNVIYNIQQGTGEINPKLGATKHVWTNSVFNKAYVGKDTLDFDTLYLYEYLQLASDAKTDSFLTIEKEEPIEECLKEYSENGHKKELRLGHTKFTIGGYFDVVITSRFENEYNTFKLLGADVENFKLLDNQYTEVTELSKTPEVLNTNTIHAKGDLTFGNDINSGFIKFKIGNKTRINVNGELNKYYKYSIDLDNAEVTENTLMPLVTTDEDLEEYAIEYSGNSFAPSRIGLICYNNEAGKHAGMCYGSAVREGNNKYTTNWQYTSPGDTDKNNSYNVGANNYRKGEKPLSGRIGVFEEIGFQDAINQLCSSYIGSPIVIFAHAGYDNVDQPLETFDITSSAINNKNKNYDFYPLAKGDGRYIGQGSEKSFNRTPVAYTVFIKSSDGNYYPTITSNYGSPSLKSESEFSSLIVKLLKQIYKRSNKQQELKIPKVEDLLYSDTCTESINTIGQYDLELKNDAHYRVKVNESLLSDIRRLFPNQNNLTLIDEDKDKYLRSIENLVPIECRIILSDQNIINDLIRRQNPILSGCVIGSDGEVIQASDTFSGDRLYWLNNGQPRIIDGTFQIYDGELKVEDNQIKMITNKTPIGNQKLGRYLTTNDGDFCFNTKMSNSAIYHYKNVGRCHGYLRGVLDLKFFS